MMASFTRYLRVLLFAVLTANLIGCGSFKNGNFNRQKYTKLKKIEAKREGESDDLNAEKKDAPETNPIIEQTNDDKVTIDFFENQPTSNESRFLEEQEEIADEEQTVHERVLPSPDNFVWGPKDAPGNKDFKKFTQTEKNKAIIEFNRLFNAGLTILILAAICFLIFGLLVLGPTTFIMWVFFVAGSIFTFFAWVISLVALNKVRRIRRNNFVGDLGVKVWLARIVAFIGITICIVTVFGGVLLGVLWLTKVI